MTEYLRDYEPIIELIASEKMTYAVYAGQTNNAKLFKCLVNLWWRDCYEMKLSSHIHELGIKILANAYYNTPTQQKHD